MKSTLLLSLFCLFFVVNVSAKIWRVNNTPGSDPDFTTIQAAIDAATAGDQINIEGGVYDGFTVNKPLSIIGTCFANSQNTDIETPMNITQVVSDILFVNGCQGSYISSINLHNSQRAMILEKGSVMVSRCKVYSMKFQSLGNNRASAIGDITFLDGVINNMGFTSKSNQDTIHISNVNISNSVVEGTIDLYTYMGVYGSRTFSGIFDQCIFLKDMVLTHRCTYQNCIFNYLKINENCGSETFNYYENYNNVLRKTYENTVINSVFTTKCFLTSEYYNSGSNNITDANDIFSGDGYYELSATSVAKAIGTSGQDAGIYGGVNPFVPGGYAALPTITRLQMPAQVNGSLNVEIKAKVIK